MQVKTNIHNLIITNVEEILGIPQLSKIFKRMQTCFITLKKMDLFTRVMPFICILAARYHFKHSSLNGIVPGQHI